MEETERIYRFDPLDRDLVRIRSQLSPGERIQAMLDAHEFIIGLIRGRLQQQYPHLSPREINLKVIEEIERAKRVRPLSRSVS
jgi:hypothetical protein